MELPCCHGNMTKENCEKILTKKGKNGSYLIRDSESIPGVLCLCVFYEQIIYTYRIFKKHNGCFMIQTSEGAPKQDFRTLKDLVAAYEKPNQGLVVHLRYPVNRPMAYQGSPRVHKPVSHDGSPRVHKPLSQQESQNVYKAVPNQGSQSFHKPVCHQGSQSLHKKRDDTYMVPDLQCRKTSTGPMLTQKFVHGSNLPFFNVYLNKEAEDDDDYVDVLAE